MSQAPQHIRKPSSLQPTQHRPSGSAHVACDSLSLESPEQSGVRISCEFVQNPDNSQGFYRSRASAKSPGPFSRLSVPGMFTNLHTGVTRLANRLSTSTSSSQPKMSAVSAFSIRTEDLGASCLSQTTFQEDMIRCSVSQSAVLARAGSVLSNLKDEIKHEKASEALLKQANST